IAMVLHELATNAAKYGALSTKEGRVSIRWDRLLNGHPRSHLVIEWQEVGGPSIITPGKPGYGTRTIRNQVPYELSGTVDLAFAPEGVRCRLELPANWLINDGEPVSEAVARAPHQWDTPAFTSIDTRRREGIGKALGRQRDGIGARMQVARRGSDVSVSQGR